MSKDYFIGVDLGGTNIKFGIVSEKGEIIRKGILPAQTHLGREAIMGNIIKAIEQTLALADKNKIKIIADFS
ncbi:MAG: hypothetical protein ABSB78_04625 [Bacteroidota bacterium]